nr:PREDICTED: chloride anion exchanger [Paralichthys olivaceus]
MMRPGAKQYVVARPLYSEDSFIEEHERVHRHRRTMLNHVKQYFTCMFCAAGLAYCLLASLPPWYGLFSAFFPVIIYFFLGTSRHISVGPFPVLCLMIGSVVTRLVPDEGPAYNITGFDGLTMDEQRVLVASSVTFLAGIMQLAMGIMQVGFVVMYLSDTLVSGFTTAAAIHILVSQLKFVLGLEVRGISGPLSIIYTLEIIFNKITSTNVCDVVISLVIMVVVFIVKELNERFKSKLPVPIPIEVIMTVIACGVSYAFDFKTRYGIDVVGHIPKIAGLLSALIVMIVTLAIGFLLEPLPKSVLGAVVIVNLKGMLMQFREIPYLWRRDKPDCVVWLGTCIASILLGLDLGLAAGLGVELLSVVLRAQFPRCSVLANIRGTDIYKDRKDYIDIYEPEGVKIFRIPSPIFFANIEFFRNKLVESIGFNPLRVLRKRNKALRMIRRLLKTGDLQWTLKGLYSSCGTIKESEDKSTMEELDQPTDFKDLPARINWNAKLPANIIVPRVDIHSLILDFAAVSFLDISALKGLKTLLKELIRVEVEVFIVACDPYILEKLHHCCFFDDEVQPSIFFLTLHDAMLHILEKHPESEEKRSNYDKIMTTVTVSYPGGGLRSRDRNALDPETRF